MFIHFHGNQVHCEHHFTDVTLAIEDTDDTYSVSELRTSLLKGLVTLKIT